MLKNPLVRALYLVFAAILFVASGCQELPKKTDAYTTATPSHQTGEVATAGTIIPEVNADQSLMRKILPPTNELLDDTLEYCYTVVQAKYVGSNTQVFEYQALIMGDEKVLSPEVIQQEIFAPASLYYRPAELTKGDTYILFIDKILTVEKPTGVGYFIYPLSAKLVESDGLVFYASGEELKSDIKNIDQLKAHISKTKPLNKNGTPLGNELEPTGILENVVAFSPFIVRGKVLWVESVYDTSMHVQCSLLEMLKGKSDLVGDGAITISVPETTLQDGDECIFMISNTGDTEKLEPGIGICTSMKNSVIPIEDTQRVNKVYELLGKQKP